MTVGRGMTLWTVCRRRGRLLLPAASTKLAGLGGRSLAQGMLHGPGNKHKIFIPYLTIPMKCDAEDALL